MPTMSHDAVWPHSRGQSWFADWYFILPRNQLLTNVPLEHERWAFKDIRGSVMTTVSHDCGHTRKHAHIHLNQVEHALIMPTDSIRTDEKLLLNLEPLEGWGVCVCVWDTKRGYWRACSRSQTDWPRNMQTMGWSRLYTHLGDLCGSQTHNPQGYYLQSPNIWRFLAKQQEVLPCWCVGTVSHSSEYTPHIL